MAPRVYVAVGDSITDSTLTGGAYPEMYSSVAVPSVDKTNLGSSGTKLQDWISFVTPDIHYVAGKPNFLSILGGNDNSHDYNNYSGSQSAYLTALAAYMDARRAVGFKVIACTSLPRVGLFAGTNFNVKRMQERAVILGWVGTHCDYICDFATDPIMGPDAAASNTSLYADGTHPTSIGSAYLATSFGIVADKIGVIHRMTWG